MVCHVYNIRAFIFKLAAKFRKKIGIRYEAILGLLISECVKHVQKPLVYK